MTTLAPKRRWFRYSLRTLFVVVTVCAVLLSWPLSWVHQRHAFLAVQQEAHSAAGFDGYESTDAEGKADVVEWRAAPIMLRLFGETGHTYVDVYVDGKDPRELTALDKQRIWEASRLFPEAAIGISHAYANEDGSSGYWGDYFGLHWADYGTPPATR